MCVIKAYLLEFVCCDFLLLIVLLCKLHECCAVDLEIQYNMIRKYFNICLKTGR